MIRVGRWQVSAEGFVLLAVVALVAVFGVGRCSGTGDEAADARLTHARAESARLAVALDAAHDSITVLQARTVSAEAGEQRARASQRATERRLAAALDSAEGILADSNASREALQIALGRLTLDARTLLTQNAMYRDSVTRLVAAFQVERMGYRNALALADSTIETERATNKALTNAAQCRILWALPCPSRTQSALGAAALTLTLVLL